MRNVTFACVLLVAGVASAQGSKSKSAAEAAKATIDKADELFNAQNTKGLAALFDKSYFGAGAAVSDKYDSPEAVTSMLEQMLTKGGGHLNREGLTIKADDDGDTAWYIADYVFIPKVGPGMLPVHRKLRESGVLVRRGKEWKYAMTHTSVVQPDANKQMAPPTTAAPVKR
jgi:hypothetical protein